MLAVKNGNLSKASILFDRYNKHLYNFFVKITMDREVGEDLTQNVFLRMIKYKHTFQKGSTFKSWIFRIARNAQADYYRKREKMQTKDVELNTFASDVLVKEDELAKSEQEKLLYIALFRLKAEQREFILLSKFEKLKYEDIATIYDTSISAIKTRVHRAIGDLKKVFFELEKIW